MKEDKSMSKAKLSCLNDIKTKLPEIVPKIGDYIFIVEQTGIPDSRKRKVLFKNQDGILCEWYEKLLERNCYRFFNFRDFSSPFSFRLWRALEE